MATQNTAQSTTKAAPTPPPATASSVKTELPDTPKDFRERFKIIETERHMFNPNKGCKGALVGHLINLVPMAPIQRGKEMQEWECFVIKTTEPCEGLDREGNVVKLPAGKEVLTPATYQLAQHLSRAASHPRVCFEVLIEPKNKIDIGHGQSMWRYDLGVNPDPKSVKARSEFGANAMLGSPELPVNQLAAKGQSGAETAGTLPDDQIPF